MTTAEAIALVEQGKKESLGMVVSQLINENAGEKEKVKGLWDRYKGEVDILDRKFDDKTIANNKLPNDYRGDIVDGKVGYFLGVPITYALDKENQKNYDAVNEELRKFKIRNDLDDLDSVSAKYASVCGYAFRLLYIDTEGEERVMNIPSWEAIVIQDKTLDETQYALIYYPTTEVIAGESRERMRAEFYTDTTIYYFIEGDDGYMPEKPSQPHNFDEVPVIKIANNDLLQGDFVKVENLVDAYDKLMSDASNELEDFRLAYLGFFGTDIEEETIQQLKELRTLIIPEDADAKWIEKNLSGVVQFLENHKDTLNENIYKFAKAVDMSDEKFSGGTQTGESRKWKILRLENDTITKERKFIKALRNQFRIVQSAWNKKSIGFDYMNLSYVFFRNLPVDLLYEADVQVKLMGSVSDETRFEISRLIDDPQKEIERIEEEGLYKIDLSENV